MPIEIKELVIKAQVMQNLPSSDSEGLSPQKIQKLKKEIVQECMDKMKEWMERKIER